MGIRPQMYLIYGVDDLKVEDYEISDPRYTMPETTDDQTWWMEAIPPAPTPYALAEGESIPEGDALQALLVNRSIAFDLGAIDYQDKPTKAKEGSDLLCWKAEGGDNQIFGHIVAETKYADLVLYGLASVDERFQQGGHIVLPKVETRHEFSIRYFDKHDLQRYRETAEWLFQWVGFTPNPDDLKLMLYWTWS